MAAEIYQQQQQPVAAEENRKSPRGHSIETQISALGGG